MDEMNNNYEIENEIEIEETDDEVEETGSGFGPLILIGAAGVGVGVLAAKLAKPGIEWCKSKIEAHKAKKAAKDDIVDEAGEAEFVESEDTTEETE